MCKKTIWAIIATMLVAGTSFAQIGRGTIGTGTFIDYAGVPIQAYGLDFNGDGTIEFKISNGERENDYIIYACTDGGNNGI